MVTRLLDRTFSRGLSAAGVALVTATTATVAVAGPPGTAAAATHPVRWASPTGTGTTPCPRSNPCGIAAAVTDAPAGAEVIIEPGRYGSSAAPVGVMDDVYTHDLDIHGETGKPMPVIFSTTGFDLPNHSSLSHVAVTTEQTTTAVYAINTVDHVRVTAAADDSTACRVYGNLTDSVCSAPGFGGIGLEYTLDNTTSSDQKFLTGFLTNVTAVASASDGIGAYVSAAHNSNVGLYLTNSVVAGGGGTDVYVSTTVAGSSATVTASHCAYQAVVNGGGPGHSSFVDQGGNVLAAPRFVDAAKGDFRELATSPTVDKGVTPAQPTTDLAGLPRVIGGGTDIGAYELPVPPRLGRFHVVRRTATALTVAGAVAARGLPTTLRANASGGRRATLRSHPSGLRPTRVRLTIRHLRAGSSYRIKLTARSAGGTASRRLRARTR